MLRRLRQRWSPMLVRRRPVQLLIFGLVTSAAWLAAQALAAAEALPPPAVLLAQTGFAKTMVGWLLTLLAIGLGLIVVCRPGGREQRIKKTKKGG